jgi:DNA-binding GntR family transcriptional regulator
MPKILAALDLGQAALVDVLEEEIVLGWLQPRERLVEEDLTRRFGTKRHLVREAIFQLERLGLVERVPNKGAVVRSLDPEEVRQVYDVRIALETLAARLIPLPVAPAISAALRAIQTRHAAAVLAEDPRAAFHANMEFHSTLFAACGNPHLADLIRQSAKKVHGARSLTAVDPAYLRQACEEHWAMIEALDSGDRGRLVTLFHDHIVPSRDVYLARFGWRGKGEPIPR